MIWRDTIKLLIISVMLKLSPTYHNLEIKDLYGSSDGSIKYVLNTVGKRAIEAIYFHFSGLFDRRYLDT